MISDLTGSREHACARALLESSITAARSPANRHTFISTSFDAAAQAARTVEWPVGLMVWSGAMRDDTVLDVSLAIEATLAARP